MITNFARKLVEGPGEPYIIAEIGSNHNGKSELARDLIAKAKECGADCVKFQSWTKTTIFSRKTYRENYFVADDYRDRTDHTLESIVEAYSFSEAQLNEAARFCRSIGIDFASTPFSEREADFLCEPLDAPFIKVASMDLSNLPFLKYLSTLGRPIILSTGMGELHEIDRAVRCIEAAGCTNIYLLHCISEYPPADSDVNLRNMTTLRSAYPDYPVGFSDHTQGFSIPLAAIALGACIIEKHFTLDKGMEGWDHKISADPHEMSIICSEARRVHESLGSSRIRVPEEQKRVESFRRSIVTRREVKAGEVLQLADLDFKRPATGISPADLEFVVGRVAKVDLPADEPILKEQLS